MLGSKNNFFKQEKHVLNKKKEDLVSVLTFISGYSETKTKLFLDAYDYFCENPSKYDGSTFSKDLIDIEGDKGFDGLDLEACLHDYMDVKLNVSSDWGVLSKSDFIFTEGIKERNKSSKTFKYFVITNFYDWYKSKGLILAKPFRFLRSRIKNGKMTQKQKEKFNEYYNIFKYA